MFSNHSFVHSSLLPLEYDEPIRKIQMKRFILLMVILALAACTIKPTSNTDSIAGYWSGKAAGELDTGGELPPRDIQIILIAGCITGKVCGKFSEDNQCPGDIILMKVDENRYSFISETASGARHICGKGDIRMFDLDLRSDGTIHFEYHNGATLTGILQRK